MSEFAVLDLFCGLGGFSSAFEDSERWDVTTVDIEERFDPDICADVFDLRPSDFEREFDVVLASPECTLLTPVRLQWGRSFDVDGNPYTSKAQDIVCLVYHTLGLIQGLNPSYWFMENPQGYLRHIIGQPVATVHYCEYGHYSKKPSDLWGTHPDMQYRKCTHESHTGENSTDFERGPSDPAERSKIPYGLSEPIRDACEAALDGEAPEQQTLGEVEP